MRLDSVAVLGGGPGGLYTARLLKLAHPEAKVAVHEQSAPEKTFGFGVAVAGRTQRNLEAADSATQADIIAAGRPHDMRMLIGDQDARVQNGALTGIARPQLLEVLSKHAEAAGVELHYGRRKRLEDLHAELVVVSDGVNSRTRTEHAEDFGAHIEVAEGFYLWAAADFALDTAIFTPVTTPHGTFVTHAYPYAPDRSTFLFETDEATWRAAGFDVTTAATAQDASDTSALSYLETAFAEHLDGHRLIGNRTRWLRFRTVRCDRWTRGNTVLLGDAAHTAHYSIGSGTKLAMEDAIALRDAVAGADDLPTALANYERTRRPQVERLQELARRSRLWWGSFPRRTQLPVDQLMIAYMTRAGNVALQRFAGTNPEITRRGLAQFAELEPESAPTEGVVEWVLSRPLQRGDRQWPNRLLVATQRESLSAPAPVEAVPPPTDAGLARVDVSLGDPWSEEGDALVKRLNDLVLAGWQGFWLTGEADRGSVLTRLDVGERLRTETNGLVVADGPATLTDELAAGVAAGRVDLVCPLEPLPDRTPTPRDTSVKCSA
ncbi:FAD-dependent monooxygenase [Streptomyces sp. NPDC102441]|uniref:FAD-dependent monooxygenase n=1 Tax=Streptomyces sp. NPDC102441 TaxID=3366176 RepID=UPI0037FDCA6A